MRRKDYAKKLYKLEKRRMFQEWTDEKNYKDRINRPARVGMSNIKVLLFYGSIVVGILNLICTNFIIGILFLIASYIVYKVMK